MANDLVPYEGNAPALVDLNGRPLVRSQLSVDVAGPSVMGGRSIQTGHPADGLTPERLARILRQAEQGDAIAYFELAEQMEEKDLHYLSVLGTRKRAVAQLPISVDAASEDPEDEADAQLVRDWLERDTLEGELFDILDAIGKGFSVTEMLWDTSSQPWLPERLKSRDQRWFEFDREDGETLMLRTSSGPEPLTAAKYIVHLHPAKTGLPIRGGLARPVAWAYLFRNYGTKDWLRFSEAYGLPLRVGKYEAGADEANIRKMLRSLVSMSADFAAAFPKSMDVEFVTADGGGGEGFEKLLIYFEQQISKAVLGQTATTDAVAGGLGSGQSTTHDAVRNDIKRADAKVLASTLNRDVVPWIVQFNRGPRKRFPRIKIGKPETDDIEGFLKVVDSAVKHGVEVGKSTFRKATGLPEPKPDEELLGAAEPKDANKRPPAAPKTLPAPSAAGKARTDLLEPLTGRESDDEKVTAAGKVDDADEITIAADGSASDFVPLIAPILEPVLDLIGEARSLGEVRRILLGATEKMDGGELTELLARATFAARLAGDAAIGRETEDGPEA